MTSRLRRAVANLRAGRGQQILCAATAGSALPLGVEVYVNHYSGSFANKWMWAPVGLLPALGLAGLAGMRSERAAHTVLPAAAVLTMAAGGLGTAPARSRHRAQARRACPRPPYNLVTGPPLLAPGSLTMVGGDRAAGGDHAPRALVAMAHDFRSADHLPKRRAGRDPAAARAAAAPAPRDHAADARPLPRLRRAGQRAPLGRGDAPRGRATRRARFRRSASSTRASSARCARSATSSPRRTPTRGSRCWRWSTRSSPPASSTATATTTCPRTRRPGGSSPPASTRRRAGRSPISTPTTRADLVDALRGRRARRAASGSALPCAQGVGRRDARRPRRLLLAPLGVERDRLRRPRVPARLHAPGRSASASPTRRARWARRIRSRRSRGRACDERGRGRTAIGAGRDPARRLRLLAKGSVGPSRQRLALPARPAPARAAEPAADGALPRRGRGRPARDRRRRRRLHARAAAGAPRLADRGARVRAVLGSRPRLGLRRGGREQALLERAARDRRRGSRRARQEQQRPRRRRLDGALRRLRPALPPLRLPHAQPRRRRRRLADLLRGPAVPTTSSSRPSCRCPGRTGRGETRTATPTRRTRSPPGAQRAREGARRPASRSGSGRSRSPTARSATARTASTAASACRAAR